MTWRMECPGCGRVSDTVEGDSVYVPPGWFGARLYFDGRFRTLAACSADCVGAAKEYYKAHYTARVQGFCKRIDDERFKKAAK
jgi:hypothetical protein